MKFGACINFKKALEAFPASADHVEIAAWDFVDINPGDELFRKMKAAIADGRFRTYSANGLFPTDLRLTGDVQWGLVRDYCKRMFDKLAQLEVSMIVFGSGKAKHVPDGFPMEQAWEQLFELGALMADIAKQYGQTVVVEPLSYNEVNIVNTYTDGVKYCRAVNRDNFKLLVDFYHFDHNGEDYATIERDRDLLYHTHIATQGNRSRPTTEEEWAFFERCISFLHRIGYHGRMSFEGGPHACAEFDAMLERMKAYYKTL